jgi:LacI family transcriptional regulator
MALEDVAMNENTQFFAESNAKDGANPSAAAEASPKLSQAIVSQWPNGEFGVRAIASETLSPTDEAAAKNDCRPGFRESSPSKARTFSVGVLVPHMNDHYATQVLAGAEEYLIEEGCFCLTANHCHKRNLIEEYPPQLMDRGIDGLFLIDTPLQHGLNLPVVAVANHRSVAGVTNVVLDQRRGAALVLEHLHELGHRKIAFMRGGSHSSDADDRWECLMAVAREFDLEVPPGLTEQVRMRVSTPDIGYGPAVELIERGEEFTALICYNDLAAIGAIRALMNRGLHVPGDVSVVGFDDIQSAAFNNPALTTVHQPLERMGLTAAAILVERMRNDETFPETVMIEPTLVVRESTCPPNSRCTRGIWI